MHKLSSRSAAAHRRPTVRHARNEEIAHVIISLQNAGKIAVHTVKSIAAMMYGDDCILDTRHISAARRMIDKIQKMKFPLEPCGEDGVLISKAEAKDRAKKGMLGCCRYDAVGSALGEAIREGMGDMPLKTAAIAVLKIESATETSLGGVEIKALIDAVRGCIPRSAFQSAEKELAVRR